MGDQDVTFILQKRNVMSKRLKIVLASIAGVVLLISGIVWLVGSSNPVTPAGYVGYLVQGSVFGKSHFYGMQTGPASPGRSWLLNVVNVSITPYTYDELFTGDSAAIAKDNLKIDFGVHLVWKVKPDQVRVFVEKYSALYDGDHPDKVVEIAYDNFLKEQLRTIARNEFQKYNGLEEKDNIDPIGEAISRGVLAITNGTPFDVSGVVVGNIQPPKDVSDAVAQKVSATQDLERMKTEVLQAEQLKQKRIVDAQGVAEAMRIINEKLTSLYVQHEAIDAQTKMVGSQTNTVVYIPVGPMGVPITGTFPTVPENKSQPKQPEQ
jgi:regulator of protease activity HflC (stomatin/prohibitin superfamily)